MQSYSITEKMIHFGRVDARGMMKVLYNSRTCPLFSRSSLVLGWVFASGWSVFCFSAWLCNVCCGVRVVDVWCVGGLAGHTALVLDLWCWIAGGPGRPGRDGSADTVGCQSLSGARSEIPPVCQHKYSVSLQNTGGMQSTA